MGKSRNVETRNGGPHSGLRLIRVEVLMTKSKNHQWPAIGEPAPPALQIVCSFVQYETLCE